MNAQALELSDNAANKVRQLRESEGNNDLMLRVYVTGGGCSGFSYGFNLLKVLMKMMLNLPMAMLKCWLIH
jgi:Fe-S cluster assembly iron-binding protein IscA